MYLICTLCFHPNKINLPLFQLMDSYAKTEQFIFTECFQLLFIYRISDTVVCLLSEHV